jgi:hypothetical protein
MRFSAKAASCGSVLTVILLSLAPAASAGPKEDVVTAAASWATALGTDDPDKVLLLYSDDAVLWGTLSPTVRVNRAALRDYFVGAFKVLPGLKVAFGDQLIRVYGGTAGEPGIGVALISAKRALILGSASAALISLLSLSITSGGTFFGALTPYHELASNPGT